MKSVQKIVSFLTFVISQAKADLEICDSVITLNEHSSQFDVRTDFRAAYSGDHETNDLQSKDVAELDSSSKKNFINNHLRDSELQIVARSNSFLEVNFELKVIFNLKIVKDNVINLIFISEFIIIFNNIYEIIRCGDRFLKESSVIEFTAIFISMYFFLNLKRSS